MPFAGRPELPVTLKNLAKLLPQTAGVRRFGSAALDMAYVAAGRYEGFWEHQLNLWDYGAGIVIVREAGGFVEALRPDADLSEGGGIIAANSETFERLAGLIRED